MHVLHKGTPLSAAATLGLEVDYLAVVGFVLLPLAPHLIGVGLLPSARRGSLTTNRGAEASLKCPLAADGPSAKLAATRQSRARGILLGLETSLTPLIPSGRQSVSALWVGLLPRRAARGDPSHVPRVVLALVCRDAHLADHLPPIGRIASAVEVLVRLCFSAFGAALHHFILPSSQA